METINESNLCSVCNKYFCPEDFKDHEEQLLIKFCDELVDQIQKLEKSSYLSSDLFNQIDQMEKNNNRKKIRYCQEKEKFIKNDIDQLKVKLKQIQKTFEKCIQTNKTKTIIIDNDQFDWNGIIY
ncbi:unnamed protein product, partial [Rotaria sp. Silwood2]